MRLNECQIILIDLNFTAKNVSKFFIKIQLTNSNLKIIRGVNPPCLMPIRVKMIPLQTDFKLSTSLTRLKKLHT